LDQDGLLRLVGAIYAAGADPQLWPDTLKAITDAIDGNEAVLGGANPQVLPWVVAPRTDPDYLASYGSYYHVRNPFAKAVNRTPPGGVLMDYEAVGEDFYDSEFFNDWCLPQGFRSAMSTTLLLEGVFAVNLVVNSPDPFEDEAVRTFRTLVPHMANAFHLNQRLAISHIERSGLAVVLGAIGHAAFLVGEEGKVFFANPLGEALLARNDCLTLREGALETVAPDSTRRLHRLIHGCARRDIEDAGGNVSVARAGGRSPVKVEVVPFSAQVFWPMSRPPAALLIVKDPERKLARRLRVIEERFGLTPAEAAYAVEVIKGDGREAAAARRGITLGTGRTHLTHIFEKTGARRQAELVRLLIESWQEAGE